MIRPFIEVMQGPVQAAAHHFGPVTSTASNVGNRSNSSQQSKRAPSPKTAKSASPKQAAKSNKNPPVYCLFLIINIIINQSYLFRQ